MRKNNPYQAFANPTVLINKFQGSSRQKGRRVLGLEAAVVRWTGSEERTGRGGMGRPCSG